MIIRVIAKKTQRVPSLIDIAILFQVFITNGILSDVVIVVAITDPTARSKAHGITLFLVEDGMPGTRLRSIRKHFNHIRSLL